MTIEQQTAEPFTGQKKNISHSLTRLLRPSSIAVIGGKWAEAVVLSCVEVGFKGDIWPVHPHKDMVAGHKAYADLASLPAAPDAVFLGVNRKTSIAMIKELSAMGAGGVVAFASGFAEVEDGKTYQDALIASAGDMAVLGPNCYGMINYLDGALLWPDVHGGTPVERGVAIITQSSNLAINLTMQLGGLPIAYTLTLGNQAMIGMADLIRVVAEDDRVTAIGLHIEGINDAPAFAAAVHDAKARGKNILALKAGLSEAAQNMTISHTASLAGGNAASEAFFDAIGIGIVHSIEEMLGGLSLLHCFGQIDDPSLMTMSCSGGEASLVADAAMRGDVPMPELSEVVTEAIKATVNPLRHPDINQALNSINEFGEASPLTYLRYDDVQHEYVVKFVPFPDGHCLVFMNDVTARISFDKIRSEFVANVSHELRSPLTALTGFIETLQTTAADDPKARVEFLGIMQEEAARMQRLIDSLLSLSRVEAQEHLHPNDNVQMVDVINEVAGLTSYRAAQRGMNIELSNHLPQSLSPIVLGKKDELSEVLHNLLENAIKYGYEDSTVKIILETDELKKMMIISVVNSGEGIEEIHLPRLTERFYRVDKARTRKLGGTGLGLAIVKHIVNRHRGRLQITSDLGGETIFSVYFPIMGA